MKSFPMKTKSFSSEGQCESHWKKKFRNRLLPRPICGYCLYTDMWLNLLAGDFKTNKCLLQVSCVWRGTKSIDLSLFKEFYVSWHVFLILGFFRKVSVFSQIFDNGQHVLFRIFDGIKPSLNLGIINTMHEELIKFD